MNKVVENGWNDSAIVNFKVQACLLRESQQLFQNGSGSSLKNGINTRVNQPGVTFSILFSNQNLILNMEMRNIIF
jgi:hypothetical protein